MTEIGYNNSVLSFLISLNIYYWLPASRLVLFTFATLDSSTWHPSNSVYSLFCHNFQLSIYGCWIHGNKSMHLNNIDDESIWLHHFSIAIWSHATRFIVAGLCQNWLEIRGWTRYLYGVHVNQHCSMSVIEMENLTFPFERKYVFLLKNVKSRDWKQPLLISRTIYNAIRSMV